VTKGKSEKIRQDRMGKEMRVEKLFSGICSRDANHWTARYNCSR